MSTLRTALVLTAAALWACCCPAFVVPSGAKAGLAAAGVGRRIMTTGPLSVRITPDGSPSMQEYRKRILEDLVQKSNDAELDGYQLFDMIVAKWGVPYGVELRRLDFAGKKLLYLNVMWKYLGQASFPLSERQYLEHLEYIARKLIQWGKVKEFKEYLADCRKKPNAYFGYAVSIPIPVTEAEIEQFVEDARLSREEDE